MDVKVVENASTNGNVSGGSNKWIIIAQFVFIGIISLLLPWIMRRSKNKMMIRKEQMLNTLQVGDKIHNNAGIVGTITAIEENTVELSTGVGEKVNIITITKESVIGKIS